jgi:hypothetical protein
VHCVNTPAKLSSPAVRIKSSKRLRCTSSRHCPSTPASLSVPADPKSKLPLRSRCVIAGHYASTPASLSASGPFISNSCSSSVLMRHQAVIAASCLKTNSSFASSVPLRESSQKLQVNRTTDRSILSTTTLTLFEVLVSMIVLPAAQVLHQSSTERLPEQQERRQQRAAIVAPA